MLYQVGGRAVALWVRSPDATGSFMTSKGPATLMWSVRSKSGKWSQPRTPPHVHKHGDFIGLVPIAPGKAAIAWSRGRSIYSAITNGRKVSRRHFVARNHGISLTRLIGSPNGRRAAVTWTGFIFNNRGSFRRYYSFRPVFASGRLGRTVTWGMPNPWPNNDEGDPGFVWSSAIENNGRVTAAYLDDRGEFRRGRRVATYKALSGRSNRAVKRTVLGSYVNRTSGLNSKFPVVVPSRSGITVLYRISGYWRARTLKPGSSRFRPAKKPVRLPKDNTSWTTAPFDWADTADGLWFFWRDGPRHIRTSRLSGSTWHTRTPAIKLPYPTCSYCLGIPIAVKTDQGPIKVMVTYNESNYEMLSIGFTP